MLSDGAFSPELPMAAILNLGEVLASHARVHPERIGAHDLERALTFRQWNARACRLANALCGLGLEKGDRIAVLAYNCVEWLEIYAAAAKGGLIAVPINFRLVGPEIAYIVGDCDARALIVQDALIGALEAIRDDLAVAPERSIHFGAARTPAGYRGYEALIAAASDAEPAVAVAPTDPWTLMYTSGTTGRPKGAIRSHLGSALLALVTAVELGFSRRDTALLVMPMCHANSLYFATSLAYCGGACAIYSRTSFDPERVLGMLADSGASFTSMVPTQYVMLLELPAAVRARCEIAGVRKLMISSAPARRETKLAVMELFPSAGLFELYGSTEAGWVTMLQPEEQLSKLGSVGRECVGTRPVRLLDDEGAEVPGGAVGELFSWTPYTFDGYWKLPEKTAEAFNAGYCSVGDMARRDEDGFLYLVDRKSNMIISGGENVYPSEVEAALAAHPAVREVAVIGLPDSKWGERVHAVVALDPERESSADELIAWCRARLAGYKRPRSMSVIAPEDFPRTATDKIQHRLLRQRIQEREPGR
jgi:acyl-CoA synthetase (AMP-forming)/AMP-acid ligase II